MYTFVIFFAEHEDYEARGEFIYFDVTAPSLVPTLGDPVQVLSSRISVTLLDDPVVEGDEILQLQLTPIDPRVQVASRSVAIVTIREDDGT